MAAIYWRNGRAYGDFRDVGGGREALSPPGRKWGTRDRSVAIQLFYRRLRELNTRPEQITINRDESGFVYVFYSEELGRVKIGHSGSASGVDRRLRTCQTGSPTLLREFFRVKTDDAAATEKKLHDKFAAERIFDDREMFYVRGEVYRCFRKLLIEHGTIYDLRILDELKHAYEFISEYEPREAETWIPPLACDPYRRAQTEMF